MSSAAEFEREMELLLFGGVAEYYPGTYTYTVNRKLDQPDDAFYFAFHILPGETFNANIGGRKTERTPVVLHLTCYCPTEIADRQSLEMAETLSRVFAQRDLKIAVGHRAVFGPPSITSSPDPKSGKHRTIAKISGFRDCMTTPPGDSF